MVYNNWVKSENIVHVIFSLTLFLPIVTNTICSVLAGHYAGQQDLTTAKKMTDVQYYFWTFYCLYLGTLLLYAGIRLLRLLNRHLLAQSNLKANIQRFKMGSLRVKIILLSGTSVLYIFAFLLVLYNVCREAIMSNMVSNVILTAFWLFIGPVAVFFVELSVLIKYSEYSLFFFISSNKLYIVLRLLST